MNKQIFGFLAGASSYLIWGLAALYWNKLSNVDIIDLVSYRIIFSFLYLVIIFLLLSPVRVAKITFLNTKAVALYIVAAVLVAINWGTFMYSASIGRGVEASLGYFLVPVINISIGWLLLKEKMSIFQKIGVFLGLIAITILSTLQSDVILWIPIAIAVPFGFYGYLKKIGKLDLYTGLLIETTTLFLIILGYMNYSGFKQISQFSYYPLSTQLLLVGTGILSLVPLFLFAFAAKQINLSTMGWLQYIAPSTHLVIGITIFGNNVTFSTWSAFFCVWFGIAIVIAGKVKKKTLKGDNI